MHQIAIVYLQFAYFLIDYRISRWRVIYIYYIIVTAYWVKFFKAAGFPQDVATKHAVVFSNNRIKPDMLPDLDKPSLKEMGIVLMGDMIAILRYAKKVVEETTCERFLVDSEDTSLTPRISSKPVVKKVTKDIASKTIVTVTPKIESVKKVVKPSPVMKKVVTIKKPISNTVNAEYLNQKQQISVKRKLISEEIHNDNNEDNWNVVEKKKAKGIIHSEDNIPKYTVRVVPKSTGMKTQQILKKSAEQKRTVFDRLGDSSVTSTTNLADTAPTFNITGIGKDVFKRSASVFNRLGDIDDKKDHSPTVGILKNGSNNTTSGILKNRISNVRTSIVTKNKIVPKTTGTMRADHEINKKNTLNNTNRTLKLGKKPITLRNINPSREKITKPVVTSNRLGM